MSEEKNFEGKVLSPTSNTRKRSSKKTKTKICKTCYRDILENEMRDMLMFSNSYHQFQAKEYCSEHTVIHSNHKCKPHWCGDCGFLTKYEIEIQKG